MSVAENKALVRRWNEEVFNKGNLDLIDELVTEDVILRDPVAGEIRGREAARELVTGYRSAFPNMHLQIEEQIAEGDKVVTRWTVRGTHEGELFGIAPTRKEATVTGIDIDRISRGRITESTVMWDALGLFRQLGVVPEQFDVKV